MTGSRWFLLALLLCRAALAHGVEAVVSYNVFHKYDKGGADSSFIEIYWQVNPASLHYRKNEKGELTAQIQTAVSIGDDKSIFHRDRYTLLTNPSLPGVATQQRIFELKRYYIAHKNAVITLDLGETEFPALNFHYAANIENGSVPTPFMSKIQLLDTSFSSTEPGTFYKNGAQQLPRVLNFYDEGQRLVHFYTETYNVSADNKLPFTQHFYISKKPGDFAISRFQLFDTLTRSGYNYHTFDISTLGSGNFYINARLKDATGAVLDTQSFFFQMINKKPEEVAIAKGDSTGAQKDEGVFMDLSKTFVSKFNIRQLLAILKMISPLADPAEANAIHNFQKKPDEMYIRYFIFNYFSKTNKVNPEREWKEFSEKIRDVNQQFNGGGKMGYETDRGIVFLKYGKPDELLHVPNEAGAQPYEVWRYNAVGATNQQGTFLFYQPAFATGDYRYLTSNVTGELQNAGWKSMLYSTGRSSGNSNSRAEQYLEGK